MATFSVNDQTRRIRAVVSSTNQQEFSVAFQSNQTTDIKVFVDGTQKTEGTHYDIKDTTGGSAVNGIAADGTCVVKFRHDSGAGIDHRPTQNQVVTIISDIALARTSVYTAGGNITAASLESDFDTVTMQMAERKEAASRAITAPKFDPTDIDMTLPDKDARKGKGLAFNATTGNPEATTFGDITSVSAGNGLAGGGTTGAISIEIDSTVATLTGSQTLTNKTINAQQLVGTIPFSVLGTSEIRSLVESATDSNVFTDADHSKLDGIESGATADQTAAEIRTLVESATDSNVFTDADHSKLNGIEASATADQTASEIRALVESATDSNVFTDADHTKLDGIETSADVTDTTNVVAALTAGTNVTIAADGTISASGSVGLANVVEDTSPQLGGTLDANNNDIDISSSSLIIDTDSDTAITNVDEVGSVSDDEIHFKLGGTNRAHLDVLRFRPSADLGFSLGQNNRRFNALHTNSADIYSALTLNNATIIFEGSTNDTNETTLTVADPTADRTITLPDASGTVALTSQLGSGGLSNVVEDTSPQLGGTLDANSQLIQFGDSSGATVNRLQLGATQNLQLYYDGTNGVLTNNGGDLYLTSFDQTILYNGGFARIITSDGSTGNVKLYYGSTPTLTAQTTSEGFDVETGILNVKNGGTQSEVRLFCESSNAHYVGLKAPAHSEFSGNVTSTLPAATGTLVGTANADAATTTTNSSDADHVLVNDGGVLKKITPANLGIGGGSGSFLSLTGGTLTGDLTLGGALVEEVYNLTGTVLDPSNGTLQYKTLAANTTFTETFSDGESITLMIDDGSSYTVTWPTMTWASGSAPTLATSGYTTVVLWHQGSLYGAVVS